MTAHMDERTKAEELGYLLQARGQTMATAESCTGGGIAEAVTGVAGSSAWFDRAFVTYSNEAKVQLLGVSSALIARYGAVSQEVVTAMAAGALDAAPVDWVIAVSGIAGPGGGSPEKPVGTVWFCWQQRGDVPRTQRILFGGDRASVRRQAVDQALDGLINRLVLRNG